MAQTDLILKHLDGDGNQLKNWSGEVLAADPTGAGLYEGRIWYNSVSLKYKYYDGTNVQTFATADDVTKINDYHGDFDASAGVPTTTNDSSPIVAGDTWRVGTAGTIVGINGADVLEIFDLVIANVDGASAAADFTGYQVNLDMPLDVARTAEVTMSLLADTPTAIALPTGWTEIHLVQCYTSADIACFPAVRGTVTARTLESSSALVGIKVVISGK